MTDTNTDRIRETLRTFFKSALDDGKPFIDVVSGELHEATEFKQGSHPNQMPSVCNIMHEFKDMDDDILHVTPSGRSSTIQIRYYLPRKIMK